MNKTMKKILSVILCVLMIFSTAAFAFAADGEIKATSKYFQKTSTDAENAAIILDMLDALLAEKNLNSKLEDYQDILDFLNIPVDLNSVNGICKTLDSVKKISLPGDLGDMNFNVWKTGMKRPNDVTILNELIELVGTTEYKKGLFGRPADKLNSEIIAGILDNSTNFGIFDGTLKKAIKKALGDDGVYGKIKEELVKIVYEKDTAEFQAAYAKKVDNIIFVDVLALINKEDGALPGFTMNANSTVDNLLLSAFYSAWNKYIADAIKSIDVDLSASENEALVKLGTIINLKGSDFDPNTVKIDLGKSFESQINDILGAVVKFFYPAAKWTAGGKDKLAGNFTQLYKDLANEFGVEANPLAIVKYVLEQVKDIEGVTDYVGDFTKWTSMKQAVAAVLTNVAKNEEIPVKASTNYETILGDMLTYAVEKYVDLGYKSGAGKNVWTVANDILNVLLIDKGFAKALNINVAKTDSLFKKIDIVLDMTGTKFANYSSEDFIKEIIDAVFNFDFAAAIDKTVVTFLNDYANEKAINVIYDAVYNTLKSCFAKEIIVARSTATPIDNAIQNASLKKTVVNILTAINAGKANILPPVLFVGALVIGKNVTDAVTIADQTYTGKAIVPASIKLGDKTLKVNTDYTAECTNNVEPGTATAVITFNNQYKGTVTKTFKIVLGKVTELKATATTTSASLTWKAVTGAKKYDVTCNGKTITVTTNKATVSGLTAGKQYDATVKAIRDKASSSAKVTFVTKPAKVAGLKVASTADTSAKLTWTKTANATSYEAQYSTDGKTWSKAVVSSTNSVTVTGLKANTSYQFRVRAVTKAAAATAYGDYSAPVKATTLIAKVAGLKATATSTTLKVTWTKVAGADSYVVEYSKDGKTWTKKTVKTNSISLTKLAANTTYQIKVTAFKGKVAGPTSAVLKAATNVAAATGLKATNTTKNSVALKWNKVAGASGYEVYRNGKKVGTIKKGSTVTFTDKKLSKNTTYKYTVKAYKVVSKKNVYGDVSATLSVKTAK